MSSRKTNEREFHDEVFSGKGNAKYYAPERTKYYAITQLNQQLYNDFITARCAHKRVLEYGCGVGDTALLLASKDARVTGIDLSEVAVRKAAAEARRQGLTSANFQAMDAEHMTFPENTFDIICGTGILHHLDLGAAYREVSRVLKPDGVGIFIEPLGHNPIINLYRKITPDLRTIDEHPLRIGDIESATKHFGKVESYYFHILTFLAVPFRKCGPLFTILLKSLRLIDRLLFTIPAIRKYAWIVVMIISKPIQERDD